MNAIRIWTLLLPWLYDGEHLENKIVVNAVWISDGMSFAPNPVYFMLKFLEKIGNEAAAKVIYNMPKTEKAKSYVQNKGC